MADGRIGQIFELLRLLGKPTTNTPLGEILRRSVIAEPLTNEVDSMLARLERVWLEQKHPQTVSLAIRIAGLLSRPLPLWLAAAALELIERNISPTDRRQRASLWKHFVRALAVVEYKLEGMHWDESWGAASVALEGTEAHGSEETIRDSYKIIQRELKEGRGELVIMWAEAMPFMGMDLRTHADVIVGTELPG